MLRIIRESISNKLMVVIMATTFIALFAYGLVMLAYDIRTYYGTLVKDLTTQANIIAEVSAPALEFNDPATAQENLELLRTRPMIMRAAIYTSEGQRFAEYAVSSADMGKWPMPQMEGDYIIDSDRITVSRQVVKDGRHLGTVYIRARYEVWARLIDYTIILAGVLVASLGLAALIALWLRGAVTKPILSVTDVARRVMKSRDFSLRAKKFSQDEIGVLVEAFNNMLSEVERRARALEESNRSLEIEMTERHAAENALRLADRRKDEFLATLAHELRNPLAPVLNSLKILRLVGRDPEQIENAQTIMERQLNHMVRLVDDLLDVSRITTGKLAVSRSLVDIRAVMKDALESCKSLIDSRSHKLNVDMPLETVYVDADPVRLAQVFSNLLNNAAKYTEPGGCITFAAKVENDKIVVSVADNGIGIENGMLKEIFEMFTQVDNSLERVYAGLGVGLALSKRLVELHEGDLRAASKGPGKGSIFSVHLDVARSTLSSGDADEKAVAVKDERRRVLLVDDNVDFIATMENLLKLVGHDVRTAHDGTSALQAAAEFAPEFIFMDIGMPGLNGYDVARLLRQQPGMDDTVLIAVTGWGGEKDRQMSRNAGFNYHLIKPVELGQILDVLELKTPPESASG